MQASIPFLSLILATLFAGFANAAVLIDFQVAQPPPVPKGAKQCTVEILRQVQSSNVYFDDLISVQTRFCLFIWKVKAVLVALA